MSRKQPKPAKMVAITQPPDWLAAFKKQAARDGQTLSAWLGQAGLARLPPDLAKRLTIRRPRGRTAQPKRKATR